MKQIAAATVGCILGIGLAQVAITISKEIDGQEVNFLFLFSGQVVEHDEQSNTLTVRGSETFPSAHEATVLFFYDKSTKWIRQDVLIKENYLFGMRNSKLKANTLAKGDTIFVLYTRAKTANVSKEIVVSNFEKS